MELIEKYIPGAEKPFWLRPNSSDEALFHVLIDQDEYGYICFGQSPQIIIDAGANIGLSAVIFALKYPLARIFALEPETVNYEMLKLNTASYPNITPVWGALMGNDGFGIIVDPGKGELAYQINHGIGVDGETDIPCMTMETLCKQFDINSIDLLKMDIEGAEYAVFHDNFKWLSKVSVLIIELHNRLCPECNYTVFQAVQSYFHLEWIGGENFYFSKSGLAVPVIPQLYKTKDPIRLPIEELWSMREYLDVQNSEFARKTDSIFERIDSLEALYHRVDELEGLYHRVDELEGLYHRVDELEGLYHRVDKLENLSQRADSFNDQIHRLEQQITSIDILDQKLLKTIEQLRYQVDILCQAPLKRLFQNYKQRKKVKEEGHL